MENIALPCAKSTITYIIPHQYCFKEIIHKKLHFRYILPIWPQEGKDKYHEQILMVFRSIQEYFIKRPVWKYFYQYSSSPESPEPESRSAQSRTSSSLSASLWHFISLSSHSSSHHSIRTSFIKSSSRSDFDWSRHS